MAVNDLWVADANGANVERLVKAAGVQTDPFWSADHTQVAYSDPQRGLRILSIKDGSDAEFTSDKSDLNPAWKSDPSTIAFSRVREKALDIFTLTVGTTDLEATPLTANPGADWDPSWSPRGDQIAFASKRDDQPAAIYVMDAQGNNQHAITTDKGIYDDPSWSPNGDWIAATRRRAVGNPKALWLIKPDGTKTQQVTDGSDSVTDPTWSANGQFIAYAAYDPTRIVVIDLQGNELYVFGAPGSDSNYPDWH
jgi:TolB protein